MKKYFILFVFTMIISLSVSCTSGILYPRITYYFKALGDRPPASATKRLKSKDKYPQELTIIFKRPLNRFKTFFDMTIFVKKQYKYLTIKQMKYTWKEGSGFFFEDALFKLPENVSDIGPEPNYYYGKDGYYWTYELTPIKIKKGDLYVDMQKVFKGTKPGDKFGLKIEIDYSFDDEPVKTQVLEYEVKVVKGSYKSPYMGL